MNSQMEAEVRERMVNKVLDLWHKRPAVIEEVIKATDELVDYIVNGKKD